MTLAIGVVGLSNKLSPSLTQYQRERIVIYLTSSYRQARVFTISSPLIHGSRRLHCHLSPLKDIVCKSRYIVANVYGEMTKLFEGLDGV